MLDEWTWSNAINVGILVVTALVGILTWLGTRKSAREAAEKWRKANEAAERSAAAAEQAAESQKRMVTLEEARQKEAVRDATKASLTAAIDRSPGVRSTNYRLVVSNSGLTPATNLDIKVEDTPINEHNLVNVEQPLSSIVIGPNSEVGFILFVHQEWAPPFPCEIEWDDDSGERGRWKGTLT